MLKRTEASKSARDPYVQFLGWSSPQPQPPHRNACFRLCFSRSLSSAVSARTLDANDPTLGSIKRLDSP